jgi:hypothetical protein
MFDENVQLPRRLRSPNEFFSDVTNGRSHMALFLEVLKERKQN